MTVTLKDIAQITGVSINTVSHALKNKPDIGKATAREIQETAARLGYRPNLAARNLVLRKTFTIGLAVNEIDNPVRVEFCEKLRTLAAADGYRLLTAPLADNWTGSIGDLLDHHVDGLIVGAVWDHACEQAAKTFLPECRRNRIPFILFGKTAGHDADCVEIDLEHSVYLLTGHLLERGCRDIALFAPSRNAANFRGYSRAMTDAGLGNAIRRIDLSSGRMEPAYDEMNMFLTSGKKPPRALIAANDLAALGAMRALREHQIRIPAQCAVAGVDNIAFARYANPSLTSVGFDNGACAATVWKLMKRRLDTPGDYSPVSIAIRQKLFIREST